jgi:hypothetical protein
LLFLLCSLMIIGTGTMLIGIEQVWIEHSTLLGIINYLFSRYPVVYHWFRDGSEAMVDISALVFPQIGISQWNFWELQKRSKNKTHLAT